MEIRHFRRSFGPGLLWAATAIGVSHLVQSTRAGAEAGLALAGVILLALILKYPFFDYGPRYAAATGESLVEGYRRIGPWAVWLYLAITAATSVIVVAAVALFTGALLLAVLGLEWPVVLAAAVVYAGTALLLGVGRFRLLDRSIKAIIVALAASTLVAAAVAAPRADPATLALWPELGADPGAVGFAFLLALIGWLPTGIDVAVWSSLWTLAKDRTEGVRTTVATARADFLVGYLGTGVLAFAFLVLGAAVMYGSGERFSAQGVAFSLQLVDLYAATLGGWARPFVLVAVLTTMISTALAVTDGFPRAIARAVEVLGGGGPAEPEDDGPGALYWVAMLAVGAVALVVLAAFAGSLLAMIDFATIVVFLTAPVLGWLNLRAVTSPEFPAEHRPGRGLRVLSYVGLVLLGGTGLVYLAWLVL